MAHQQEIARFFFCSLDAKSKSLRRQLHRWGRPRSGVNVRAGGANGGVRILKPRFSSALNTSAHSRMVLQYYADFKGVFRILLGMLI